ncbi:MAG: FtsX-like permease family protein, partial [Lachnospiraceae bacterium]
IGGLDRYDSGDLIINGRSTDKYTDRDWDTYRNHSVGFVFQTYNLIPHQTVLSNVELALTISGVSKSERRARAREALVQVGLGDHLHKRPNQMSGGQMQRVAIARALVNDHDILLADEPTGALDTDTSLQVMELLREVAKDRLVVMVTHNPELAKTYATRIVKLRDGRIIDDSAPYEEEKLQTVSPSSEPVKKSSMSFRTALSLSFHNLRTKKGRTLLTAFAGSIGIIGIALILSLSNGVNSYITDVQKETMTSYPITVEETTMDLSSLMEMGSSAHGGQDGEQQEHGLDAVYSDGRDLEMASSITTSITENNLTKFKQYLDDEDSAIHDYVGENGIVYSYDIQFRVYTYDTEQVLIDIGGAGMEQLNRFGISAGDGMGMMMSGSYNHFEQLMPGVEGKLISPTVTDSYDVLYGDWPAAYDEVVLVLDEQNEIPATTLYELGLLPSSEYKQLMEKINRGETITLDTHSWSYEEICSQDFYLLPACDLYVENERGTFDSIEDDQTELEEMFGQAVALKITGVIRPREDAQNASVTQAIGYTKALTDYVMERTKESDVIKAQSADPTVNVLNGMAFSPDDDAERIADTKVYLANLGVSDKAALCKDMLQSMYAAAGSEQVSAMAQMSETELASALDAYLLNPEDDVLLSIYERYISVGSYDDNMEVFGLISEDAPSSIDIYVDSFEDKDGVSECIEQYNTSADEEDQITYTDYIGLLLSSVTTIVNVISYVLIAFVAVSLVVSSIMIGIITYISVLERTKEIGILRAIGASKRNISQVFNAETLIIGLCAGTIGVGISLLLLIPVNAVIHVIAESDDVNAALPFAGGMILIVLSTLLTIIGGLIPSKKAAKKDPVSALRTE